MKQGIVAQAFCIQVIVYFGDVSGLPEMHQAMNLVDQWSRWTNKRFVAHAGILALIPLLQLHGTACTLFLLFFCLALLSVACNGFLLNWRLATSASQEIVTGRQRCIREATGDGIEDTWSNRRTVHSKIVTMQEIVGGYIVKTTYGICPAIVGKHSTNYEVHHHTPYMPQ